MKTRKIIILGMVTASIIFTSGCVKIWRKSIDQKTYMITSQRNLEPLPKPIGDKLWIDNVTVLPPFNIRSLILRDNEVEFEASYYSELLISPSENFRNNFYTWFSDSGIFQDVSISSSSDSSHKLSVSIIRFYGNIEGGDQKTVLSVKVTLFDERSNGMRVLFSKGYEQEEPLSNKAAEELIQNYNKSLHTILTACESDLLAALQK